MEKFNELLISLQINQRLFREIVNQLIGQNIEKQFQLILDNNDRIINELRNTLRNHFHANSNTAQLSRAVSAEEANEAVYRPMRDNPSELLVANERIVTEKFKYVCQWPGCEYGTKFRANLVKHLSKHSSDKRYVCDWPQCGKRYKQSSALTTHKRCHLELKPFKCDFIGCHYRTNNRSSLPSHKRTHNGIKPFICDWDNCSVTCSTLTHLRDHQMLHRKEKPFKCDVCEQCFAKKCNMTAHKKSVHLGVKRVRNKNNITNQLF